MYSPGLPVGEIKQYWKNYIQRVFSQRDRKLEVDDPPDNGASAWSRLTALAGVSHRI